MKNSRIAKKEATALEEPFFEASGIIRRWLREERGIPSFPLAGCGALFDTEYQLLEPIIPRPIAMSIIQQIIFLKFSGEDVVRATLHGCLRP